MVQRIVNIRKKEIVFQPFLVALSIVLKALDGIALFGNIPQYLMLLCAFIMVLDLALLNRKIKISTFKPLIILLILLLYYVVWSCLFLIDRQYQSDSFHELFRKIIMIVYCGVASFYIFNYRCLYSSIKYTYIGLLFFMTFLFLLNINKINLLDTISSFWANSSSDRYRTLFSFQSNNIAGELAFFVIILSVFYKYLTQKKVIVVLGDILMFFIIIANNSRGTFLVALFFFALLISYRFFHKKSAKEILRLCFGILLVGVIGLMVYLIKENQNFEQFFYAINRYHFIDNINIVNSSGRMLIGLGNFSGAFFKEQHYINNLYTNYMEMFYPSVYIRSGIIGCIWLFCLLTYFTSFIFLKTKYSKRFFDIWVILLFVYSFTFSLFEQYFFNNGYVSFIFIFTITLADIYYLSEKRRKNN